MEHLIGLFVNLVVELNPRRELSHGPLVQVLFTLQNIPTLEGLAGGAEPAFGASQNLDGHTGTAKFDVALFLSEARDRLQCSIELNTDLFFAPTIASFADSFSALLSGIVRNPDASHRYLPLLDAPSRARRIEMEALLGEIEGLSEEELQELLSRE